MKDTAPQGQSKSRDTGPGRRVETVPPDDPNLQLAVGPLRRIRWLWMALPGHMGAPIIPEVIPNHSDRSAWPARLHGLLGLAVVLLSLPARALP